MVDVVDGVRLRLNRLHRRRVLQQPLLPRVPLRLPPGRQPAAHTHS